MLDREFMAFIERAWLLWQINRWESAARRALRNGQTCAADVAIQTAAELRKEYNSHE